MQAIAEPEIADLPIFKNVIDRVAFLRARIVADRIGRSRLFFINLRSPSQESIAPIVNSVRDAYLSFINSQATNQDQQLLTLLNNEQRRKQTEIETLQERVKSLARQSVTNGNPVAFADADEAAPALFNPIAALNEKLHENELAILSRETQYGVAKAIIANQNLEPAPRDVENWIDTQSKVAELRATIANLRDDAENEAMVARRRELARNELKAKETKLRDSREELRPKAEEAIVVAMKERNAAKLATIAAELDVHGEEKKILEERLKEERSKVQKVSDSSLAFEFMAQDLQRQKTVAERIGDRIAAIETESRALSDVTVLAEAQTPAAPIATWPTRNIAIASVAGFATPFLLLTLWSGAGSALTLVRRKRIADDQESAQE